MNQEYFKTVVLSDIHLGLEYSKTKEVTDFLQHVTCDTLILNGDIVDGWQIQKSTKHWTSAHTKFLMTVARLLENNKTRIIYLRGNHDDFLDQLIPFQMINISIQTNYTLIGINGKKYFVTHGDMFDSVTKHFKMLALVGHWSYTVLLKVNKLYNKYRLWRGKPYYSISQKLKHSVKIAVSRMTGYEKEMINYAKFFKYDGIICGHIHHPANEIMDGIHYLNSGDWVESMTALVEDLNGEWRIIKYTDWKSELS